MFDSIWYQGKLGLEKAMAEPVDPNVELSQYEHTGFTRNGNEVLITPVLDSPCSRLKLGQACTSRSRHATNSAESGAISPLRYLCFAFR